MSRSIHTTKRDWEELRRTDYSDAKRYVEDRHRLFSERLRKRRVKEQVREERIQEANPLPPLGYQPVPVRVRDESECVHYPATEDDIIGVARFLPKGVLDGITMVDLCLGMDDQGLLPEDDGSEPDPLTGRLGYEHLSGVYAGRYLGTYSRLSAWIQLSAYVYKPNTEHRPIVEFYLKLQMLSTFAHEVAHHYDMMHRVARGRWLRDSSEKNEIYAEHNQHSWAQDAVVSYLRSAYPEQVKKLDAWLRYHGGVSVPLETLAGDPRTTSKGNPRGVAWIKFDVQSAFEQLLTNAIKGVAVAQSRLEFARELHYAEDYERALRIIDLLLTADADDLEAITLKADICEHQERYAEARELVESVLRQDARHHDALWIMVYICQDTDEWHGLLNACNRLLELGELAPVPMARLLISRARARLGLGDADGAAEDLGAVDAVEWRGPHGAPPWIRRQIAEFRQCLRQEP